MQRRRSSRIFQQASIFYDIKSLFMFTHSNKYVYFESISKERFLKTLFAFNVYFKRMFLICSYAIVRQNMDYFRCSIHKQIYQRPFSVLKCHLQYFKWQIFILVLINLNIVMIVCLTVVTKIRLFIHFQNFIHKIILFFLFLDNLHQSHKVVYLY